MRGEEPPADLFSYRPPEQAHARHSDPDTSHDAARSVSPKVAKVQRQVLAYAASKPDGFTDRHLQDAFADSTSTYRTRRSELVAKGYIRDSGERSVLHGRRRFIVWQVTLDGLNALAREQTRD